MPAADRGVIATILVKLNDSSTKKLIRRYRLAEVEERHGN